MQNKALVVIDIQNDITKHYKDIIDNINATVDWAVSNGMHVVYIKHNNITDGTRTFKPDSKGAELVPELKVVSDKIFVKTKSNALTSEPFATFIKENNITEFYITGADATACVKSTCFNMTKAGYTVHVFSDCVTSYDLKKIPKMLAYYRSFSAMPTGFNISAAARRRLWGAMLSVKALYPYEKKWNTEFMPAIEALFEEYKDDIDLYHLAFPEDWVNQLKM